MSRAICDKFLWDAVRCQKSTEVQELGCRGIGFFDLSKRERPSGCDRVGLVGRQHPALGEHRFAMVLIDLEIDNKTTLGFVDICTCLIKSEWETIKSNCYIGCFVLFFIRSLLALCTVQQELRSFPQAHILHFDGRCINRSSRLGTCREQNAPLAMLREKIADKRDIIGIIKNQQPWLLALL